jgi:hypothetical protein
MSAGALTGVLSLFFHYPLDVVRVRLCSDMTMFNTPRLYAVKEKLSFLLLREYLIAQKK